MQKTARNDYLLKLFNQVLDNINILGNFFT